MKKIIKPMFLGFLGLSLWCCAIPTLWASSADNFVCAVRLMKNNCWTDYNLSVQTYDASTEKPVGNPIVLEKGTSDLTVPIPCSPSQTLSFKATYSPPVWANEQNVSYSTMNFWQAPSQLPKGATQWIVSLCFANDFTSVPLPLQATAQCVCNFDTLANSKVVQNQY